MSEWAEILRLYGDGVAADGQHWRNSDHPSLGTLRDRATINATVFRNDEDDA